MFYKFKYLIRHPRFALHLSHNIISNSHEIKFNISLTKENYAQTYFVFMQVDYLGYLKIL